MRGIRSWQTLSPTTPTLDPPATQSFRITPSDAVPLSTLRKGVYVGVGGSPAMQGARDAASVTWTNVPAGALIPFRAAFVLATGTTAGDLVGIA